MTEIARVRYWDAQLGLAARVGHDHVVSVCFFCILLLYWRTPRWSIALLTTWCQTSLTISCLPPSRVDPEVQGLKVIIARRISRSIKHLARIYSYGNSVWALNWSWHSTSWTRFNTVLGPGVASVSLTKQRIINVPWLRWSKNRLSVFPSFSPLLHLPVPFFSYLKSSSAFKLRFQSKVAYN